MDQKFNVLKKINNINDLKTLSNNELDILSKEIRNVMLDKVSKVGGHLGPNLGVIELTIALHYVFNSPIDKMIWDVSHQTYTHKILTGRFKGFENFKTTNEMSGFTNRNESEHDLFNIGHTSTSISLASGLAKARDLKGTKENIIAIIGDGSLSGGEAFEGLNNVGDFKSNFIIIVNDNEMSIGKNYGGLYKNLQQLRETKGSYENNYFKTLGFEYKYIEEGNNLSILIEELKKVKDIDKPIVVHIHTKKGYGYKFSEDLPERFHYSAPFDLITGEILNKNNKETYTSVIANYISDLTKADNNIVVANAATCGGIGFMKFRDENLDKYFDVGIAEEHLIAFTSGLASGGMKPIAIFTSTFIQRAYDQISQDLCLNNSPALIIVENAGISSADVTHVGMYDISMLSNIPNFVYLAPATAEETKKMIDWSLIQNFPIGIRVPSGEVSSLKHSLSLKYELNKFEVVKKGSKVALLGLGNFFKLAEEVDDKLNQYGINATLINPRFITGIDVELLEKLQDEHEIIITLEDGVLDGGFGEKISRYYSDKNVKVYSFGATKEFIDRVPYKELLKKYNLTAEEIINKIIKIN